MTLPRTRLESIDADGSDDQSSLALDAWRTPSANRPARITIQATADPTGGSSAEIHLEVDESGGTTADYQLLHNAPAGLGSSQTIVWSFPLPAGGSYRVANTSDPDNGNSIDVVREFLQ